MLRALRARLQQGYRTIDFPNQLPELPPRFRGRPEFDGEKCADGCRDCAGACPTGAIEARGGAPVTVDLGRCLFCNDCVEACPTGAVSHQRDYRLATRTRDALAVSDAPIQLAGALARPVVQMLGRSLKLRVVSAGGCNGCEPEVNVLGTVLYDIGRFGIQYVASPRHADGLLITGPITRSMRAAVRETYDAVPDPKVVIAVGACAISGGPYLDHEQCHNGATDVLPVDLFIPGCPPHPATILDGLLRLIGRL